LIVVQVFLSNLPNQLMSRHASLYYAARRSRVTRSALIYPVNRYTHFFNLLKPTGYGKHQQV
jgi:hypothetical protein